MKECEKCLVRLHLYWSFHAQTAANSTNMSFSAGPNIRSFIYGFQRLVSILNNISEGPYSLLLVGF